MPYQHAVEPYQARIIWRGSVSDPAHIIWAATPDGCAFHGTRFSRWLVRLLGWSITKQWKRNQIVLKEYNLSPDSYIVG